MDPQPAEYVQVGSRRPDGTYRKPIRVKPGYVPPDEASTYRSAGTRAREARQRRGPPGLPPGLAEQAAAGTAADGKKKKKKKKKKNADGGGGGGVGGAEATVAAATSGMAQLSVASEGSTAAAAPPAVAGAEAVVDQDKLLRKLRKKLRQLETLQAKVDAGEELNAEQKEKLAGFDRLRGQIAEIEGQ